MSTENIVERLALIEEMIAEGRRSQEYFGQSFVLWGIGYVLAVLLMVVLHIHPMWAWGTTMCACGLINSYWCFKWAKTHDKITTIDRAISAIWISGGITLFVSLFLLGPLGYVDSIPIVLTLVVGVVNFACGLILRFKMQIAMGIMWWLSFVGYAAAPQQIGHGIVFAMVVIGQIFFGIYLMILERRDNPRVEVS